MLPYAIDVLLLERFDDKIVINCNTNNGNLHEYRTEVKPVVWSVTRQSAHLTYLIKAVEGSKLIILVLGRRRTRYIKP